MAYTAHKLYRSRRGKIFGICQGLAEWRDLNVTYIRLFMVIAFLVTGFFPVGILYFLAALLLPLEPEGFGGDEDRERSQDQFDGVRRDFSDLKDRVRKMEERVFDRERDWDNRFHDGK